MDNRVFISYRRSISSFIARAVFQDLVLNGIDTFMDVESLDAGQFDRVILHEIASRPYFLIILAPGALDHCVEPGDWLRRELEHALKLNRLIIPLITPNFDFCDVHKYLKGQLAKELPRFQALKVDHEWFEEGMVRLRTRFLKPVDRPVTLAPKSDEKAAPPEAAITIKHLTARDYFERGLARPKHDLDGKIADYSAAIHLDSQFAVAYNNRGIAHYARGDLDGAFADYSEAIRLNPRFADAYNNRGCVYYDKCDLDRALADHTEAIRLNARFVDAYKYRGFVRQTRGDLDGALADYSQAIRWDPRDTLAYCNRALVLNVKGDLDRAIVDYSAAIQLDPQFANAYYNRALARAQRREFEQAIADGQRFLELQPDGPVTLKMRSRVAKWTERLNAYF